MQLKLAFPQHSLPYSDSPIFYSGRELGTFKDSLRAPIHRWFKYPAGFSYKLADESFKLFDITPGQWVYDPFSGSGTTLLQAKQLGVNAYGVEAHEFVHWVAGVKLYWEFDPPVLNEQIDTFLRATEQSIQQEVIHTSVEGQFPELIYKCYHPSDLIVLYLIRQAIQKIAPSPFQNFLKLALTDALRGAAVAGTGWPYISPRGDIHLSKPQQAWNVFKKTVWQMANDLWQFHAPPQASIFNVLGDSRQTQATLADEQIQLALTSPPYLNNYDYADRTRLETYFWGIASTWGEITRKYRDKLIVAATTQVTRNQHTVETALSAQLEMIQPHIYRVIQTTVLKLAQERLTKGGKKDYDLMTALYFNDMLAVLQEVFRLLSKGGHFCLVLGDSAPYGVHIATDDLIGQIGLGLGFSRYDYYPLRQRGDKWKDNPQRHRVKLREGIVILTK